MALSKLLMFLATVSLAMAQLSLAKNSPKTFLDIHNKYRAVDGVKPLVWNKTLEGIAVKYSTKKSTNCEMVHSDGPYGENLAQGSGDFGAAEAIKLWVDEKNYYDYESNTCSIGEIACGHYTQVVWNTTTDVGCGRVQCKNNDWWFITCNYYPPGNYVGERPF
ncbi:pathogenesis-related protein 1A-like [Diospyros lotus]|uniref:pathogenesis-related protein 1A-like n=1 Tax=Diospyros lotus TaxID=55363 RepID=UPI002253322D|nr:pathogenesis-related protein 1A-like [Diospyros lotus]